jgi:putative peptidoglycan lipid II flippase
MFIDSIFASMQQSTVAYLYFTERLNQFVTTIIGHTLSTVSLTLMAEHFKNGDVVAAKNIQQKSISLAIIWGIPAALCLATLALPIVEIIYQRGSFTATDTDVVAKMLQILCIAMPFISISRIYYSCLYSMDKVKMPVIIGLCAVAINFSINMLLYQKIQHYYVVIATATSSITEWFLLTLVLKFKYNFTPYNRKIFFVITKSIVMSIVVAIVSCMLFNAINAMYSTLLAICIAVICGVLLYVFLLIITKTTTKNILNPIL